MEIMENMEDLWKSIETQFPVFGAQQHNFDGDYLLSAAGFHLMM